MLGFLFVIAHMQDIIAGLAAVSLAVVLLGQARSIAIPTRLPREVNVAILLAVYLIVNVWVNGGLVGLTLVDFVRQYGRVFYVLALLVIFYFRRPDDRMEWSYYPAAIYAGFIISAVSLYSHLVSRITIADVSLSGETRLLGTLGGANPTAASLGLVILIFMVSLTRGRERDTPVRVRWFIWPMILVILWAFFLTKSRGYILALVVTVAAMIASELVQALRRGRVAIGAAAGLVMLVGLGVGAVMSLESRFQANLLADRSVATRLALFARAWNFTLRSPLLGLGLGTSEQANVVVEDIVPGILAVRRSGEYLHTTVAFSTEGGLHVHNVYLQLLSETGVVGVTLLLIVILTGLRRGWRVSRLTSPSPRGDDVLRAAHLNLRIVWFVSLFLAVAGLAAGYTFLSPSTAWLLYIALGRLARQHQHLAFRTRSVAGAPTLSTTLAKPSS